MTCAAISSCTKQVDIETPERTSKQVISAYLQAGDTIEAFINTSLPYSNENVVPTFDTAYKVDLYKNGDFVERLKTKERKINFFVDSSYFIYQSTQTAEQGATYELISNHPTLPIASGSDKIPTLSKVNAFEVDTATHAITITLENNSYIDYYVFNCEAVDLSGETFNLSLGSTESSIEVDDGSGLLSIGSSNTLGQRLFLKNDLTGNRTLTFFYSEPSTTTQDDSVTFVINRVTKSYYKHETSKLTQEPIIPIFPEPNKLFTNITGGFGIVAGGNKLKLKFNR
jgi:hypothetical protein